MVTGEVEHAYVCPHCWQRPSLLVDVSVPGEQTFVQDCEVCCTPIEFTVVVDNGEIRSFSTQAAND